MHWLDDNESLPQYRPDRPHILRIGHGPGARGQRRDLRQRRTDRPLRRPVVPRARHRAEPRAARWSRSPGAVDRPNVLEVALGTTLRRASSPTAGADPDPQAVLLGGYGGAWFRGDHLDTPYSNEALRPLGGTVGAGIIVVLPEGACGLVETHRIVELDGQRERAPVRSVRLRSAGARRGPHASWCTRSATPSSVLDRLEERCGVIEGRGACRHPDGVVRLVRSALEVFADGHREPRAGRDRAPGRRASRALGRRCRRSSTRRTWYGSETQSRRASCCRSIRSSATASATAPNSRPNWCRSTSGATRSSRASRRHWPTSASSSRRATPYAAVRARPCTSPSARRPRVAEVDRDADRRRVVVARRRCPR